MMRAKNATAALGLSLLIAAVSPATAAEEGPGEGQTYSFEAPGMPPQLPPVYHPVPVIAPAPRAEEPPRPAARSREEAETAPAVRVQKEAAPLPVRAQQAPAAQPVVSVREEPAPPPAVRVEKKPAAPARESIGAVTAMRVPETSATALTAAAEESSARIAAKNNYDILRLADESRGNLEGISWQVVIETNENGRKDSMAYDIKARGFNISGINTAPPKHKGNKLLMLDSSMWFHKPGLSKPIPISMRQKLMGKASYGDVASTNYAEDYEATRLPDEVVNGVPCYVFDLKARNSRTTYDRIKYWVAKDRLIGLKAEYYTLSGKRFKSASMEYDSTMLINGQKRPFISRIAIYEELMSGDVTYLTMNHPRFEPLPDYVFNLNLFMK